MKTYLVLGAATMAIAATGATPAYAKAGDFLLRARAVFVAPNESSSGVSPAFPGEHVKVSDSFAPELDLTYFATDHIGFELIAATTKHHVDGTSGTTGSIGRLASTWVLPPTLTAQYHFIPDGHVRPYVGAGINYTVFWNTRASDALVAAVGPTHVGLSDSVGWAVQGGVDIDLTPKVFLNFDIKYIGIKTTGYLNTTAAGLQTVRVNLDPIVAGAGIGFRF